MNFVIVGTSLLMTHFLTAENTTEIQSELGRIGIESVSQFKKLEFTLNNGERINIYRV